MGAGRLTEPANRADGQPMPRFRSVTLVLALLVFAAFPAAAVAHDSGSADSPTLDSGADYVDDGSDLVDDGNDYADDGSDYADDGSDYADDGSDCLAYLDDPEDDGTDYGDYDGNETCDDAGDGTDMGAPGLDTPDFAPSPPRIPQPAQPRFVHLHGNGTVWASPKLPRVVRRVIAAANRIATRPYRYGGGHGSFYDKAYDCSGSVSYALHGGGLLFSTLTSGDLARWGAKGRGKWITIYANKSHVYMVVAGMRYDTGARPRGGTRWDPWQRPARGFAVRHPAGL
jgi:hypothetical protein